MIHWIRQEILHHADARKSLSEFQKINENLCRKGEILNKEQIINILCHIECWHIKIQIYHPKGNR